ncbi:uncharacterized protein LOC130515087 isoform X2 [Takifugu flavidus]|uniref:uncharacterized protein LOC130515087 isoform X2 n=1 Tax=Takifugu flavidus TaxID=433684 RepID=UPI002544AAEE|nr:uncharacterized protein LOC130515087 isoform X2 [Takifugu flavidus]
MHLTQSCCRPETTSEDSPGLRTNGKSRSQSLDQRGSESKLLAPCSSRSCWLLPTLPTAPVLKELDWSVNWSDLDPREGLRPPLGSPSQVFPLLSLMRLWSCSGLVRWRVGLRTLGLGTLGLRTLGLGTVGLRTVGLGTLGLRTLGLGTVGLRTVDLRTLGLGAVGLRTLGLGTAGLGTLGLRTLGLGTAGLGTTGLGAVGLRTAGLGTAGLGAVGLRTAGLGTAGLRTLGLGTVGLRTVDLRTLGLGAVGLRTVGLGTLGLRTVGLGTVGLRTVDLRTLDLRTLGLGTAGLGAVGLRTAGLGTVGLGTVDLRTLGLGAVGLRTLGLGTVGLGTLGLRTLGLGTVGLGTLGLGCRSDKLKHVLSLRRQCFMFLTCPSQTLDVSFRVRHGHYMVYASSGSMRCFECGDVGHKRVACPHRPANEGARTGAMSSCVAPPSGGGGEGAADAGGGPSGQVEEQGGGECVAAVRAGREGAVEEVRMGVNVQEEEQPGAGGVSGDQGQAAGEQLPDQPVEMLSVDEGGEEVMESDSWGSVADSQSLTGDLYTLEDVTTFLDKTFGQSVKVADYFPDPEKFLKSALLLQREWTSTSWMRGSTS